MAILIFIYFLTDAKINCPIPFKLHAGTQPVDGKLLAFLRLFCMNRESLECWLQSENTANLMHAECGIETEVEDKSWSFLKGRCQLLLQLYPTTKDVTFHHSLHTYKNKCSLSLRVLIFPISITGRRQVARGRFESSSSHVCLVTSS